MSLCLEHILEHIYRSTKCLEQTLYRKQKQLIFLCPINFRQLRLTISQWSQKRQPTCHIRHATAHRACPAVWAPIQHSHYPPITHGRVLLATETGIHFAASTRSRIIVEWNKIQTDSWSDAVVGCGRSEQFR